MSVSDHGARDFRWREAPPTMARIFRLPSYLFAACCFELRVSAILPEPRIVQFVFKMRGVQGQWEFQMPYSDDAETLDVGVRQAARNLVRFAEALATEAAKMD